MNKKVFYSVLLLIVAITILLWLLKKSAPIQTVPEAEQTMHTNVPTPSAPVLQKETISQQQSADPLQQLQARNEQIKQDSARELSLWQSPIIYYGKVVDESNQPISGVSVSYNVNTLDASETAIQKTGTASSDERGIFKIDGVNGIGLMLQLSHPHYYSYPDNSTGYDKRSLPRKGYFSDSEENAELFRMHSKGNPVPLVHRAGGVNAPLNGTPVTLNLRGSAYNQIIGNLVVVATGNPPQRYNQQPFDWDVKINVPDGGLTEYTNYFDFVAPETGYQPSVEFYFPKETNVWTATVSHNYFVKLPSGYARLNIYIGAKSPLFFSVQYDYNPDGSLNLERAK